jgi:hypothetical protein
MEREALKLAQEPASVTYKEVQDLMNALEKGNLYQQVIAEELGQRKLYTTAPAAQPAQEPFGYLSIGENPIFQKEKPEIGRWEILYTAPPQRPWVSLTEEDIDVIYEQHHNQYGECESPNFGYERAILKKSKEKNT